MTTQLFIYNEALGHLGERQLASLSEPREPRRVLDSYWSDVVGFCLSQGLWKFAKRTILIDNSSSLTPQFGYNYCSLILFSLVKSTYAASVLRSREKRPLRFGQFRGVVAPREQVPVSVHRHQDGRMPQPLLHH